MNQYSGPYVPPVADIQQTFMAAFQAHQTGRLDAAEAGYVQVLQVQPNHADALHFLGVLNGQIGRFDQAEQLIRQAIAVRPVPNFLENLGFALMNQGKGEEATEVYRQLLAVVPEHPGAFHNLGIIYKDMGRYEEAETATKNALRIAPDYVDAMMNLTQVYVQQERYAEAEEACRKLIRIAPGDRGISGMMLNLFQFQCAWKSIPQAEAETAAVIARGAPADLPTWTILASPSFGSADQRKVTEMYMRYHFGDAPTDLPRQPLASAAGDRLRIGYVSGDFRNHPVGFLVAGVIEEHDPECVEVTLYSHCSNRLEDDYYRRFSTGKQRFVDVSTLTPAAAAERIRADGIDILVDLHGLTTNARPAITVQRPAPIQVNWLGYPGTLGDPRMADYLIGDPIVTPLEHAGYYAETIAQMPNCYQPNDNRRGIGAATSRAAEGLPEQAFVFCCFNGSYKITPEMFGTWCDLLKAVPDSVLWLARPNEMAVDNLIAEAKARGIAGERIVFAARKDRVEDHLARIALADLGLDTYPYNSHTTGSDALWAGVPFVTRIGDTYASRVAASLLHAVGLDALVTASQDDYFRLCLDLARDSARLAALRAGLEQRKATAPLFDTRRFVRDLESLYLRMAEQHRNGQRAPLLPNDTEQST